MFFLNKKKEKRIWPYLLLAFFVLAIVGGVWAYQWFKNLTLADILRSQPAQNYIQTQLSSKDRSSADLLLKFLGIDEPKNYLFLFLNNTELRPGGGFIGSYAVINVDKGTVNILKVEGTEILDKKTPADWRPTPPRPIAEYLGVDRWYFRDSNWSPDFAESGKKALEFYNKEGGLWGEDVDAVVGITPEAIKEAMKITGPITADGITFSSENILEKLQYETNFGYSERGLVFTERKKIMGELIAELAKKVKATLPQNIKRYKDALTMLLDEKHILFYAVDDDWQKELANFGLTGEMTDSSGDYLLWADANLAALKTDWILKRTLGYSFEKNADGRLLARASTEYNHPGKFDWRTTRYRTYARVFVPEGSELVGVDGAMKTDRSQEPGAVDKGHENGRQWFGAFIAIEPGKTGTLTFTYLLPEIISEQMEKGMYTLFVQKQIGTVDAGLTLDLNFGKNITGAEPAELKEEWGDGVYRLQSDLRVDREFSVKF